MTETKNPIDDQEAKAALIQLIEGGKSLEEAEGLSDDMRSRISEMLNQTAGRKIPGLELDSALIAGNFRPEFERRGGCIALQWRADGYFEGVRAIVKNARTGEELDLWLGRGISGQLFIDPKELGFDHISDIGSIRFYHIS